MDKKQIKIRVKEALATIMPEGTREDKHSADNKAKHQANNNNEKSGEGGRKDYSDIKSAIERIGGPSMVDVMKLMGIPDDKKGVNRSLFRKKVKQIKNKQTGSYYQFSDEELPEVRAALHIKK